MNMDPEQLLVILFRQLSVSSEVCPVAEMPVKHVDCSNITGTKGTKPNSQYEYVSIDPFLSYHFVQ